MKYYRPLISPFNAIFWLSQRRLITLDLFWPKRYYFFFTKKKKKLKLILDNKFSHYTLCFCQNYHPWCKLFICHNSILCTIIHTRKPANIYHSENAAVHLVHRILSLLLSQYPWPSSFYVKPNYRLMVLGLRDLWSESRTLTNGCSGYFSYVTFLW